MLRLWVKDVRPARRVPQLRLLRLLIFGRCWDCLPSCPQRSGATQLIFLRVHVDDARRCQAVAPAAAACVPAGAAPPSRR